MARIHLIEPIVEEALEKVPATRGDNFILYIEVLKHYVDPRLSLKEVFIHHKELGIPALESITRCRRKLQEKNPNLRDERVTKIRAIEEENFIDYSKE